MKKYTSYLLLFFTLLAISWQAGAQNISNRGRDFWVGYGHHQFMEPGQTPANGQNMVLYFSAEQVAVVTVTIRGITATTVQTYSVPANSVISTSTMPKAGTTDVRLYDLPPTFGGNGGETLFNRSIHIESDVPIVAYAHIYGSVASGATMLLPTESWGYSYTSINSQQTNAAASFSWMYVVANRDNSVVRIIPSQRSRLGKLPGVPFTVTLNRGEIYQLVGETIGNNGVELTGTTVQSIANAAGECYPVAVFSGSSRTGGFCGGVAGGSRDNDMQQGFPQQAWGKKYLTAPFSKSQGAAQFFTNMFKVAVKDPTTVVTRNGFPLTGLANNYYYYESNTADVIEADKPIMVAQFLPASGGTCAGGSLGDPEMVYISPVEQGIKNIGFYRNTLEAINLNYLTLIIPTTGVSSLVIDGSSTFDHTYPHTNAPGFTIVVKRWTASQAQVRVSSDSAFTAITYGLGGAESYGYNAGTFLNNLNAVGSIYNPSDTSSTTTSHPFTCTNTPVKLSVLLRYPTPPTRLVWRLSAVGGGLAPNTDVTDNAPTPVGTQVVNGVTYSKYDLPGNYTFTTAGTYSIPILATHPSIDNCNNTEEVSYNIEVRGKPSTNFAINHTGCLLDTVHFVGQTPSANGFNINQWLYTFHDATTSISKDTAKLYAAPGTYNVNLRIVSTEGCVGDTSKQVIIGAAPVSSFTISDPTVCEGTSISFNSTATYAGITNYYWDFGDGTIVNTASPAAQTHAYSTYGIFTVRHAISVGPVCISDTASQTVTISATPTSSFTYPAGCLPATGVVQFNSTALAPDGQAITGHLWTFGDPASGAANTSTLANPTHTYPGFGSYTITYTSTTVNGCFKDTTVNATFNLAPSFTYPALPSVCGNSAGTVSVATATVTNGVPGTGIYNGPGTTTAGIFNPVTAGPGTHTIWYVYTATSGCTDSVSQTIVVAAAPDPAFSFSPAGCLPTTGQVAFTATGTPQTGQTYVWNFGDPASGANNTSALANPTHNFTPGTYTITLTVNNPATGCSQTQTITQLFSVTPQLNYPALAPACENLTSVNVATATVTNGVAGTGVYSGPGTTAAGIFNPAVAGAGIHTITYTFTGTGNCVATITQTIVVNAKPNASFTYPTVACLPPTGIANFTYNGSLSAGQTYAWNFGDPASGANNTSTLQNPTHTYTNTGTYSVSVTVTNTNGCVDDSVINNIVFSVTPALSYPALAAICSNDAAISVATATVTNGVTGTGVYSGPGTTPAGNFDPAIAGPGNHTITYTFTSAANCVATITQTIRVNPAPSAAFTASTTACLPASGNVVFTYTGAAQAGQTWLWNFGDPASGANNTSALQNPSHNFAEGNYMIILTVTNPVTGCVDKDTLTQTFALTPALNYPALTATCENLTNINVATATVTNGVPGTGVYSGPGTTPAGIFDPAIAGPGNHTIIYTFTSGANCVATITQTISVNPAPSAAFTASTTACLPANGNVAFTYTGTAQAGQTWLWNFGDPASGVNNTSALQNPLHNFAEGNYMIILTVTNPATGCVDKDTLTQTFALTPALNYPALPATCENLTNINVATATVTNGVPGTGVYSGPGTTPAGIFNPSVAGPGLHTITYTFTSTGNCVQSIDADILVNPKPNASFTYPTAACLPPTGIANFTYNGSLSAGQTYSWNFGDPASGANNTSTLQNPSHTYTNTGTYSVSVTVTNANGCIDDSVINNIVFSVTPILNYPALTPVCENQTSVNVAFATVTNGVAGTGVYSGTGTTAAGIFNPSVAGPGLHTITYTFTSTGNCVQSIDADILVNAKPNASFTYPTAACLPPTGIASFTYNGSLSAGQTYSWNFGDPASGVNNTSALQNPTHTYTNTGTYSVSVTVTNANGCIDDSVINNIVFSVTPILNYPALTPVCENETSLNVAIATVTNGVTGTGVYSGLGTSASGIFNPSVAGPGNQTITYTFTSTGNCVVTIPQTIVVNPKPVSAFTITANICLGAQANITSNATIPTGTITTWKWFFGDGNTATYTNGNPFTYLYTAFGSYEVKLVTVSANGCESDTARQTIVVGTVPIASFTMPSSVCMPDGVTFNNNSSVTDGSTLTYVWNFGDPASGGNNSSTQRSPTHIYATAGSYTVSLRATGGNGCFKDTVQVFDKFFDKPIAAFTVTPTELCQGSDNVFTDASSAPNSTISSRLWIFGDGTTSTATNPTKRYSQPGQYLVKLVVTNAQGCISDTAREPVTVHLQPVVDAGPSFVVAQGSVIQLQGTGNDNTGATTYLWTPSTGLSNPASLTPQLTAVAEQTYTLTATGSGNCTDTDFMTVKILRPIKIPNAFSPNGDGINDTWIIENLADYPGAIVEVYNRYGQMVMKSTGYSRPWDGTISGKPLPLATYYYIIQLKNGFKPLNGSITIIK